MQFPGQIDVRVMGVNAFASINDAVNAFDQQLDNVIKGGTATSPAAPAQPEQTIPTIYIASGLYEENVFLQQPIHLIGSGSESDTTGNTVISANNLSLPVLGISYLASGHSPDNPLQISNIHITGSNSSGVVLSSSGSVEVAPDKFSNEPGTSNRLSGTTINEYITFDSVTVVDNLNGFHIDHFDMVNDIRLIDCNVSNNSNHGFHIPTNISSFDSLIVSGSQFNDNGITGITTGPGGSPGVDNIHISNSTFSGNGDALSPSGSGSGDISFFLFNGDASLTDVTIVGDGAHMGVQFRGEGSADPEDVEQAGIIVLDNVNISGQYQHPNTWTGSGIFIARYSDVSNISFTNVVLNVSSVGEKLSSNLTIDQAVYGPLDVGNTSFGGNASQDIFNLMPEQMDANDAIFVDAEDNFEIEDRVFHGLDAPVHGLVRWTGKQVYVTAKPDTSVVLGDIVSVVSSGDTINLSGGTFFDTTGVVITKNLTFLGSSTSTTICRPLGDATGEGDAGAWLTVNAGATVNMANITFDGSGFDILRALRVYGGGWCRSLTFRNFSAPDGKGIACVIRSEEAIQITDCLFENINWIGVRFAGSGVAGSLFRNNTYVGKGSGSHLDYGVVIEEGASVILRQNTIYDCLGVLENGETLSSAGIWINAQEGGNTNATIDTNFVYNCYNGIKVGSGTEDDNFVTVRNSEIYDNEVGICVASTLVARIEDNHIHDNGTGIQMQHAVAFDIDSDLIEYNDTGISIENSVGQLGEFGEIDNNIIANNFGNGVVILDDFSTGVNVHNNEFCSNGGGEGYALRNDGTNSVSATENWWGAADGPSGDGNGSGDAIEGPVDFTQFETESIFEASPCSEVALCVGDGDVNNDGTISADDALAAFDIALSDGNLSPEFDVEGFECEIVAADVNCDENVGAQDALDIFLRALADLDPEACFSGLALTKRAGLSPRLSLASAPTTSDLSTELRVALQVSDANGLQAISAKLTYPADKVDFVGIERSDATTDWTQLDARANQAGQVTLAGFNLDQMQSTAQTELVYLRFEKKTEAEGAVEITLASVADDLEYATLESAAIDANASVPGSFALHQNYPNPFNPETMIQYDIPHLNGDEVKVQIKIYNVKGQTVRSLGGAKKSAGTHKIKWDGKNDSGIPVPSGTYFYTIKAGQFKDTKKMMLIK